MFLHRDRWYNRREDTGILIANQKYPMKKITADNAPDLTKTAPRSPRVALGGYVILARTIDKCHAAIWGNVGEYHFDCPLDNQLFSFKGIKGSDFKAFVQDTGAPDEAILEWVINNGVQKTAAEIAEWSKKMTANNYADAPDKKKWLVGELTKLGLSSDKTLFDYLEADDKASFAKK